MSFNGSGTFVVNTAGQPVVPNTVISSTAFNALTADLANGLSTCITKDGQTTPTANIPMGNNKITGLAAGTAGTDAANLSQVQGSTAKLLQSVTGTDTITAAMIPALTTYTAGQMFYFVAAGNNTGPVTINIDSLGAKSVTRDGSTALVSGDIVSGEIALIVYDGTRFQLLNGNSFTNLNVSGTLAVGSTSTFTGAATFSAGTANQVQYLNASKVLTGSANLTFDGTTLTANALTLTNNPTFSAGTANGVLYLNGSKVATSGSALVFDGTNLGIGAASPGYLLHVERPSYGVTGYFFTNDGTRNPRLVIYGSADGTTLQHTWSTSASNLIFASGGAIGSGTEIARFDASGNFGLGVTPSGWSIKALQVNNSSIANDSNDTYIQSNAFFDGAWKYINSAEAAQYYQVNGSHVWRYAASGTAGNTITFSQAMTLDASGNLGIGTASPAFKLDIAGNARILNSGADSQLIVSAPSDSYAPGIRWAVSGIRNSGILGFPAGEDSLVYRSLGSSFSTGTECFRVTVSGNFGIGTASPAQRLDVTGAANSVQARFGNVAGRGLTIGTATVSGTNDAGAVFNAPTTEGTLIFQTNTAERMRITQAGNIVAGASAALATTATDGFLYVPTCAGTPTGTPTAITGMAPIVVDTTNNKLYFYSGGAWRDAGP